MVAIELSRIVSRAEGAWKAMNRSNSKMKGRGKNDESKEGGNKSDLF